MQKYDYQVISSTAVKGVPLEMVRRTALSEDGQSAGVTLSRITGILDPSKHLPSLRGRALHGLYWNSRQAAVRYEHPNRRNAKAVRG